VVHFDVAPRNILDSEAGRVWIIDFESNFLLDEMWEDGRREKTTVFRMIKDIESGKKWKC
jgi:hypothetical protein